MNHSLFISLVVIVVAWSLMSPRAKGCILLFLIVFICGLLPWIAIPIFLIWSLSESSSESFSRVRFPMPDQDWMKAHKMEPVKVRAPERKLDENPIRPDQIERFRAISPDMDLSEVMGLGDQQAETMLARLKEERVKRFKAFLKKYYAWHGYSVPNVLIDYLVSHPDESFTLARKDVRHRTLLGAFLSWAFSFPCCRNILQFPLRTR